jgi:hypothetical protein
MRILFIAAALTLLALLILQDRKLGQARLDHQQLLNLQSNPRALGTERTAGFANADESGELEHLRHANREIHKLRGQIGQLRQQKAETEALRAENKRLRLELEARRHAGRRDAHQPEAIFEAGQTTPEDTLRTFVWAMQQGRLDLIAQCDPKMIETLENMTGERGESFASEMIKNSRFAFFQILSRRELGPDRVELQIRTLEPRVQSDGLLELRPGETSTLSLERRGDVWVLTRSPFATGGR